MQLFTGQQFEISGSRFGSEPGQVVLIVGGFELPAQVTQWSDILAVATLPELPIANSSLAQIDVRNALGQSVNRLDIELLPASGMPEFTDGGNAARVVVSPGQSISIDGALGVNPGQVLLNVNGLSLRADVRSWSAEQATVVLPQLQFSSSMDAVVQVIAADGSIASEVPVILANREAVVALRK